MITKEYLEWEKKSLEKFGWFTHFVPDENYPLGVNIHTHGIKESFSHPDIQIIIGLPPEIVQSILHPLVKKIKAGKTFKAGESYSKIIKGFKVRFESTFECGRAVLRMILPDPKGHLEKDKMDPGYARQYEGCVNPTLN